VGAAVKAKSSSPQTLRVATYNIHKGVVNDFFGLRRNSRIYDLRARLHELNADLIFLQEVQGRNDRHTNRLANWPAEPQDQFLAKVPRHQKAAHNTIAVAYENVYGQNANYLHGHHGNALLSRFPVLRNENRDVSDHALEKRGVLHCVVALDKKPVHCFVVHFGLLARSRRRQTEALMTWIKKSVPPDEPLIIAGDFNDWRNVLSDTLCHELNMLEVTDASKDAKRPKVAAARDTAYGAAQKIVYFMHGKLNDLGMTLAKEKMRIPRTVKAARTFPALMPWLQMDRIYVRGLKVKEAKVLRGAEWSRLSDHSPLIADLVLE
jgi:endonuclease/exonuclease/phosphatase family metal-dependent hydrolase